jgi:hypothetical protein
VLWLAVLSMLVWNGAARRTGTVADRVPFTTRRRLRRTSTLTYLLSTTTTGAKRTVAFAP